MLRVILGICITVLSAFSGKKFTEKYTKSYLFFLSLGSFNSAAIRNMSFQKNGICKMLEIRFDCKDFNDYLSQMSFSIENEKEYPPPPQYLEEKDKYAVLEYFSGIGRFSSAGEKDFLLTKREEFSCRISELKSEANRFSSLGLKLGFAFGIAAFILLI